MERRGAGVDELFPFALALGNRAACTLDVRPRARMAAVQEQDAGPDVDGKLVLSGKIMVEAGQEQFLDARFTIAL